MGKVAKGTHGINWSLRAHITYHNVFTGRGGACPQLSLPSDFPLNDNLFHMGGQVQGEGWVRLLISLAHMDF